MSGYGGAQPKERAGRYQRSFSGLIGAMIVLLAVVLAFIAFRAINRSDVESPIKPIDYTQGLSELREAADFPLLAPSTLPEGWIATSERFDPTSPQSWHLGVLNEDERYFGLEQATSPVPDMVREYVGDDAREGDKVTDGAGVEWRTFTDSGGDHAIVREQDGVTTLVVSSRPISEILEYEALLVAG